MKKTVKIFIISLVMLAVLGSAGCEKKSAENKNEKNSQKKEMITSFDTKHQTLQEQVAKYLKDSNFSGTVLISQGKKILAMASNGESITNDSIYQIGSNTKQFTSCAIMMLVDQKKISLDDPLSKYVKEMTNSSDTTIEQLLSMRSGIPEFTSHVMKDDSDIESLQKEYEKGYLISLMKDKKLDFEPGTSFEYSNCNYYLLATVIERVTKMSYEEFITKNILEPCNMKHTSFNINDTNVIGHDDQGNELTKMSDELSFGCGDICSTVEDVNLFVSNLMAGNLISKSSMDKAFQEQKIMNSLSFGYGFGWYVGGNQYYHTGNTLGFNSMIFYDKSSDTIIICENNKAGELSRIVQQSLFKIVLAKK